MITAVLLWRKYPLKNDTQNNILLKLVSNLGEFSKRTMSLFKEHDNLIKYSRGMFFVV
jgi:hypothetical protein